MKLKELFGYIQREVKCEDGVGSDNVEVTFKNDRMVINRGYVTLVVDSEGHEIEIYNE